MIAVGFASTGCDMKAAQAGAWGRQRYYRTLVLPIQHRPADPLQVDGFFDHQRSGVEPANYLDRIAVCGGLQGGCQGLVVAVWGYDEHSLHWFILSKRSRLDRALPAEGKQSSQKEG
jgi:hypothetical protein